MSNFDLALSIMLGVGLAAATGFRVFLPMLVVSVASYTRHLSGGIGNLVLATLELGGALLVSLLALAAPLAALAVVLLLLWVARRLLRRLLRAAHRSND